MNLLQLRKKKGLTQREAAELLNCSLFAYGRYERGERQPSLNMLKKMSELFDANVDYLIANGDKFDRNELNKYEKELLEASRCSDERARQDALMILKKNKVKDK